MKAFDFIKVERRPFARLIRQSKDAFWRRLALTLAMVAVIATPLSAVEDSVLQSLAPAFERIPIQSEGRIKPLDTYARGQLLLLNEKSTVDGLKASEWLVELLLYPSDAHSRKVFKVRTDEVVQSVSLVPSPDHAYSFTELSKAMVPEMEMIEALRQKDSEELSPPEKQLVELYNKTLLYFDISRSLSGFLPDIVINETQLASDLGFTVGEAVSYYEIIKVKDVIGEKMGILEEALDREEKSEYEQGLIDLVSQLREKLRDLGSRSLRIVMPSGDIEALDWKTPWAMLDGHRLSELEFEMSEKLADLIRASLNKDYDRAMTVSDAFPSHALLESEMDRELGYNEGDYFYRSLYFYLLSALVLGGSALGFRKILYRISIISFVIGLGLHGYGILLRCIILERPPVSTLYESIIFVGFVIALAAIFFEWSRKNGIGTFLGTVSGAMLHFIGFSYASEGDTLGMLVAVLNSNFWLATHVLTITIGYGISFLAGLVAHAYLIVKALWPDNKSKAKELFRNAQGLSFVAIFFTTLGTILGGIWADQSWGRFWGWDPKENGALLIVLWLLIVLHGRLAGVYKELGYAVGLGLVNITVALAWFGVNLLSVGLHNYGFDDGVATNLFIYCVFELVFCIGVGLIANVRMNAGSTVPKTT